MILLYLCTFLWAKFDTEFIIISALHQAKLWLTHLAAGSSRLWESCVSVMFSVSCSSCGWVVVGSGNLATGAAGNKYPVPRRVWASRQQQRGVKVVLLVDTFHHHRCRCRWSITSYHLSSLVTNPHFHIHVTDRSIAQKWLEHRTSACRDSSWSGGAHTQTPTVMTLQHSSPATRVWNADLVCTGQPLEPSAAAAQPRQDGGWRGPGRGPLHRQEVPPGQHVQPHRRLLPRRDHRR